MVYLRELVHGFKISPDLIIVRSRRISSPAGSFKTVASLVAVQFCFILYEANADPSKGSVNEIHASECSSSSIDVKRRKME